MYCAPNYMDHNIIIIELTFQQKTNLYILRTEILI